MAYGGTYDDYRDVQWMEDEDEFIPPAPHSSQPDLAIANPIQGVTAPPGHPYYQQIVSGDV